MQVAFHCGCGTVIQVDPTIVGRWMHCPVCRRKISRSELQGPRAQILPGVGSGDSPPPGSFVRPGWPHSAQQPLPWGWITAAATALLFLLLALLGWSVWEHLAFRLAHQEEQSPPRPAASASPQSNSGSSTSAGGALQSENAQDVPSALPETNPSPPSPAATPPSPAQEERSHQTVSPPTPVPVQAEPPNSTPLLGDRPPATSPSTTPIADALNAGPSWQRIVDRQGAFEVLFPRGRISREQTAGVYGPLHMQLALTAWGEFRVIYTDFPPSVPLRGMDDVQRAFGPMLQELYGPVQGYPRPIQLHGFPGMRLRFAKGHTQTLAHVFLVRRRVYLVLWTGTAQPPWLDRFFAAFDLPWARR